MSLISSIFGGGDSKSDNSTKATEAPNNVSQGALGTVATGDRSNSAAAQDQAVTVSGSGKVDQSLKVNYTSKDTVTTGSVTGGIKGDNNTVNMQQTDHGAIASSFDFAQSVMADQGATARTALAANVVTSQAAFENNALTTAMSLDSVDKATARAMDLAATAMSNQRADSQAASDAMRATSQAALESNALTTAMSLDSADKAFAGALDTVRQNSDSAFAFASEMGGKSIDAVSQANATSLDYMHDNTATVLDTMNQVLQNNQVATIQAVNGLETIARGATSTAGDLVSSTVEKFAQNQSPSLTENTTWITGAVTVGVGLVVGLIVILFRAPAPAPRPTRPAPNPSRKMPKK